MFGTIKTMFFGVALSFFAVAPTSTNFTLKAYDFGNGGGAGSSTNYKADASTGTQSGSGLSSTSYSVKGGVLPTQNANVPTATFTNPSSEYNRLKLVIGTANNPTDTVYQVAISTDSFVTTNYVQNDNTIGSGGAVATYQSYASWGSASGVWIVGLASNTTYQVKVRALQGRFSGSPYGPVVSASTLQPSITFSVTTSLTATPPFLVGFTSLPAGVVTDGNATANISLSTNSINGGAVYIKSSGGLSSALAGFTIPSATANLSVAGSGYGAIVSSATQTSGGPFTATAPYNGVANNVGVLTTSLVSILSTSTSLNTGLATITLKAKSATLTPSATDYTDTLTLVAAMLY